MNYMNHIYPGVSKPCLRESLCGYVQGAQHYIHIQSSLPATIQRNINLTDVMTMSIQTIIA